MTNKRTHTVPSCITATCRSKLLRLRIARVCERVHVCFSDESTPFWNGLYTPTCCGYCSARSVCVYMKSRARVWGPTRTSTHRGGAETSIYVFSGEIKQKEQAGEENAYMP